MTKPPWYGGNKIPDSYLKRFSIPAPKEEQEMPWELRVFLSEIGANNGSTTDRNTRDAG
jgi:hypothetical protein